MTALGVIFYLLGVADLVVAGYALGVGRPMLAVPGIILGIWFTWQGAEQ